MAAFDAGVVEGDVDVPGQGRVPIDTIGMGGLVVAVPAVHVGLRRRGRQPVETFEFDARTVRAWCAVDMALSYEVTWRVAKVLTRRLKSMRSRLRKPS